MTTLLLLLVTALPATGDKTPPKPNTLTPQEIADGWVLLFDGQTTFGWKVQGEAKVHGGTLVLGGTKETVVSTTSPSLPFAVRMSPFGASVIPSGPFSGMPVNTVRRPPVAGKKRNGASGIVSS